MLSHIDSFNITLWFLVIDYYTECRWGSLVTDYYFKYYGSLEKSWHILLFSFVKMCHDDLIFSLVNISLRIISEAEFLVQTWYVAFVYLINKEIEPH